MKTPLFSQVEDFRVQGRCMHLLSDVLFIALSTIICNGEDFEDMEEFGNQREEWLSSILSLPFGIPKHDTFNRVLSHIKPESLSQCLIDDGNALLGLIKDSHISFDGKKTKGTHPKSKGNGGLYILSAWVNGSNVCIGQVPVEDKSNEITAIPELIKSIDIKGSIVSIDAIGCQKDIAQKLIESEADYVLALKKNQSSTLEEVEKLFESATSLAFDETFNKGHGRFEERKCTIFSLDSKVSQSTELKKWEELKTLIKIDSIREESGNITESTRYYLSSSDNKSPIYFNNIVRSHWGIENALHWNLDVVFKEDASRARTGYAQENLNILRKLALHRVERMPQKLSKQKKRYRASLNNEYLQEIIGF